MRKTIAWATITLLLVVCFQDPVVSRTTPFPPDDGSNTDHPWGGDQASDRETARSQITSSGIPSIDIMNHFLFKWLYLHKGKEQKKPNIIPGTGTTTTTQTTNPNAAN